MGWLKPRSIRGQLILGLVLLEGLLVVVFATLLVREQASELHGRVSLRLKSEARLLALQSQDFLSQDQAGYLSPIVRAMLSAPNIRAAMVTDSAGRVVASSDPSQDGKDILAPFERRRLPAVSDVMLFAAPGGAREGVAPIRVAGKITGYAWVFEDDRIERQQIFSLVRIIVIFAALGALGAAIIAGFLSRSITRPLNTLLAATGKLIRDPESKEGFPIEVSSTNEAADLTRAFNLMVNSIEEQRGGLNDTLALLDSMLENAPIGFAFFDHKFRYVRINQFLADMDRTSISHHLGRTISEVMSGPHAELLQSCVHDVFRTGHAVRDFELNSQASDSDPARSWLINVYPVKTKAQSVRWVGAVIVETTERKNSEEALRKTEKLAAAGRLAASIAHEINNPLEAITNLLYLLRLEPSLDRNAQGYVESAQYEVSRVSEMTQQTLRFYRQSTFPALSNIPEVLESVLSLLQGKMQSQHIEVFRDFGSDVDLFCFSGEIRQLFANLVSNAIDAMPGGGSLRLKVRRSRSWLDGASGVRVFVEDNGVGMSEETRRRIFEPFFTTKEDTGTGLGLWVSEEIVRKHSGSMKVMSRMRGLFPSQSNLANGTVFMIFFPENGVAASQLPAEPASAAPDQEPEKDASRFAKRALV